MILRPHRILRADLQANPTTLYAFGDNMARTGLGGQAREMRGEPNAVGIVTKWRPSREPGAYFTDAALTDPAVLAALREAFAHLDAALAAGCNVAIPADGIGTGLAELPVRAPRLYGLIERRIAGLGAILAPDAHP